MRHLCGSTVTAKRETMPCCSVADTGIGMNEETKKRIFEPFFTTKEIGKGTGLGLATVYGIVKAHDGFINVYSEPGKGSVFHVYFPLASTTNAVPEPDRQNPVPLKGGNEIILLAEDDVSLRNMTSAVLRDMGYTVIEAEDGNNAVARFIENRAAIKLVILDGIMPKMNGLRSISGNQRSQPNDPLHFHERLRGRSIRPGRPADGDDVSIEAGKALRAVEQGQGKCLTEHSKGQSGCVNTRLLTHR